MYDNIGGKIKGLAKVSFILAAIAEVITGIALMATSEYLVGYGLLVMVVGPIVAWISSWLLYGFGQLIENSDIVAGRKKASSENHNEQIPVQRCADDYKFIDITCPNCKASLTYPKWQLQSDEDLTCPFCDTLISI